MKCRSGICAATVACLLTGTILAADEVKNEPPPGERIRIYQLFVRLFGNTNETRKPNGSLGENGVGKFNDINDAALTSLRAMGFTHIWLTGILQQATAADYSDIGQPADDPDLLKGLAGSPYAIKDYFDVCPDYAAKPEERLEEFRSLLARIHKHGMKALIDFVPNHVARSYHSDIKPELNFGTKGNGGGGDNASIFFSPQNNFFYLKPGSGGPPLSLPTFQDGKAISPTCETVATLYERRAEKDGGHRPPLQNCDGLFEPEKERGKVTGDNKATWRPDINSWYETVKLNYGFNFEDGKTREYPNALTPQKAIPDTWKKMAAIIDYWQSMGVDGFRCDMSHMVPPEFWKWLIAQARAKDVDVVFIGEAYDNDPAKVPGADSAASGKAGNVMVDLLNAGFTAVYDDPTYRAIKKIYEGPGWANDIDSNRDALVFEKSLRYAENHDEVRLAAKSQWGGLGAKVGFPVAAILYGLSRGPIMMYNGQEVGEPASGAEGFGGDDARTSIFDYWSMPEFTKWVNGGKYDGGKLSDDQKELRAAYARLINLQDEPAFRRGAFVPLNDANRTNAKYGRLPGETVSGHWLYTFLRYDKESGQRFLLAVNLNPRETLKDVSVRVEAKAIEQLDLKIVDPKTPLTLTDRLAVNEPSTATSCASELAATGVWIGDIPPLTARYYEIQL